MPQSVRPSHRAPLPTLLMSALLSALFVFAMTAISLPGTAFASVAKEAACSVNLRTSASTSAGIKATLKTGTKVTVATSVTGSAWKATCNGKTISSKYWYRISAVNGKSAKSLYGVTYVYGALYLFRPVTTTGYTRYAACSAYLRTSPSTTSPSKAIIATDTKVFVATPVTGAAWSATCAGRATSGPYWYQISSVNGQSVQSLYGVSYIYAPNGLFKTAPTGAPTPTPTPASGPYPPDRTLAYVATPAAPLPGYLAPVTDPTWGTRTTRVTSIAGVRNIYSRISAWNSDGTKLLLGFKYPGRMLDGRTYADLGSFNQVSGAVWSNTDPNKLFGVSAASNVLYAQNATTGALTVLHVFSGYATSSIGGWGGISIGDGEGGVDDTDTYIALMAQTSAGAQHIITYNLRTDAIIADIAVSSRPNNVQISRKGNYVVVVGSTTRRYSRDLSSSIQLYGQGYHGDNALDVNGNEIYVANNASGVRAFRLSDGTGTQLLPSGTAFEYGHVSGRNITRPGWVYLSVYDNGVTAGRAGHDQLIAVKTDGSGTVEVFGFSHHQGTVYAAMPMTVAAPDGRRVLFGSDWGASAVYSYVAGQ